MHLKGLKIGFAITGSFCTFEKILPVLKKVIDNGAEVYPIVSESVKSTDTRFGKASDFVSKIEKITGNKIISTITEAEPIGPESLLDVLTVAPCTGNTIAKIANAISDTTVTMACKAQLRNLKPVIIAISTNDGLAGNASNIGQLLNMKNLYIVPFKQDNPVEKKNSLVSDYNMLIPTIKEALKGKQIQPVLI